MSSQLGNIGFETDSAEQAGNFFPQPSGRYRYFNRRIPQNIPDLFFHAATIPPRTTLQSSFD
jgi:hypothetical protein